MGEVYRARDERLGRTVAIKVLRGDEAGEAATRRLVREARAAAALDHPNICAIHEIGEQAGRPYIVLQYVEGETLARRLERGPLDLREALDVAISIAEALDEAHRHGILHRDVKPQNLMITKGRQVKVMDFGLAKPIATGAIVSTEERTLSSLTQPGTVAGTLSYMSPEQARGDPLDARSDVFSLGVVVYEMACGRHPFAAASAAETLSALLTREAAPLDRHGGAPHELERIVAKALRKDRDERYQTMRDLLIDLKALRDELDHEARLARSDLARKAAPEPPSLEGVGRARRKLWRPAVWLVLAALLALGGFATRAYLRHHNEAWAADSVARLSRLAQEGKYPEAYELARRVQPVRPNDADLARILPLVSDDLSVSTDPPGATVWLQRAETPTEPPQTLAGKTPLNHASIPRGDYVLRLELAGREPFERTISSGPARTEFAGGLSTAIQVDVRLRETGTIPPRMVAVPGGRYRLVGWGQPTASEVHLDDFFLDRFEVSHREYREFVVAGGYRNRDLWRHPFVRKGRTLSWEEAMRLLVDRTGLPGPRDWSGGSPPPGLEGHPVTGVTWYEAAAYAAFRGKALPTVYQWEKAARDGIFVYGGEQVMPWGIGHGPTRLWPADFEGDGTVAVDHFEFGMSPYGAYNMAGNVSEWIANRTPDGFVTTGGSWRDPPYIFGDYGAFPEFHASDHLGFRCALTAPGAAGDQGGAPITAREQAPSYPRSSEASFRSWLSHYRYDRTPLDPLVEEAVETPEWRRERIRFLGARSQPTYAYLYLPKSARPPYQVIQFVPGSGAYNGVPPNDFVESGRLAPLVKAGRAIFLVALPGYFGRERPAGQRWPDNTSVGFRERAVGEATDERRGLDYLETRPELDLRKLAFMNVSISWQGIVFSAVEPRYRVVVLMACGVYPVQADWIAEANPIYFAPHIRVPKLMINGRWDEDFPFKIDAQPLFDLLAEPKKLELYDGGHVPPAEVAVPVVNRWLDEVLGPVRRN
jgi:serine/threonine protein kinase